MAPAELEGAFAEGIGFDGSAIEGFARVYEADMLAKPDPSTFQILPWRTARGPATARMFCDIVMPDGSPSYADPRYVLKRTLSKAADKGFTFYTHPEIEFYLFKDAPGHGDEPVPVDRSGFFDHTAQSQGCRLPPRGDHDARGDGHLGGVQPPRGRPGPAGDRPALRRRAHHRRQHHDLPHRDPGGRARARASGPRSCPSRSPRTPARACTRTSRSSRATTTPSSRPAPEYQLSKTGRQFIAGILRHASEISVVTNQWVNSYKRMMGGGEAPSYICWGHNNRSAMIRVPMYKPNKGQSTRIELRTLDAACNPYLAFAVVLAAGMKGIEEGYELPREAEDDVWSLTERERKASASTPLPKSLYDAIGDRRELRAARRDPRRARLRLLPAQQARRVGRVPRPGLRLRARPDAPGHLRSGRQVSPRILVVEHEAACPPHLFGALAGGGRLHARRYCRPYAGDALPALDGVRRAAGARRPMGANDDERTPWLRPGARTLIRDAVDAGIPTLGICLGHQLIAVALGGGSARNPRGQQVGLLPVGWTEAAADDRAGSAPHRRRASRSSGTTTSSSPCCPAARSWRGRRDGEVQVARYGPRAWGVQLHPEVDADVVIGRGPPRTATTSSRWASTQDAVLAEIEDAAHELEPPGGRWPRASPTMAAETRRSAR